MKFDDAIKIERILLVILIGLTSICFALLISGRGILVGETSEIFEVPVGPDRVMGGVLIPGELAPEAGKHTVFKCTYFSGRGVVEVKLTDILQCPFVEYIG